MPSWTSGVSPNERSSARMRSRTRAAAGEPTGWGAPSPTRSRSTACARPAENSVAGADAGFAGGGPPWSASSSARASSASAAASPQPAGRSPGSTTPLDPPWTAIVTSLRLDRARILDQIHGARRGAGRDVDAHPPPHLPSLQLMAQAAEDLLFGRIALHYKLVTREQVLEATQIQTNEGGGRPLSEILTERGILTPRQVEQILAVQRDYVAKQQAQTPAGPAPAAEPLRAQAMPALSVQAMPSLAVAEPPAAVAPAPVPPPPAPTPAPAAGRVGIAFDLEAPRALDRLLKYALSVGASDLHLHSGAPLKIRVNGLLADLSSRPTPARTAEKLVEEILTPEQREALRERGQVDFAYTLAGQGRFRSNAYRQQRGIDAVFRGIPPPAPTLDPH